MINKKNKMKFIGILLIFIMITPIGITTYQTSLVINQDDTLNNNFEKYLNLKLLNEKQSPQDNSKTTQPNVPNLDFTDPTQNSDNTEHNYESPYIDTSMMNKTTYYDSSALDLLYQQIINGEFSLEQAFIQSQGMTTEYTEKYTNETHTVINRTISVINNDPINIEDAIIKAIPTDLIDDFQIIKKQEVTDYNKHFISLEMAKNLESLIKQNIINCSIDILEFQQSIEKILNDTILIASVKYFPKNGFNNNNPIISKLLYDTSQTRILFDCFTSNIMKPRLDNRSILLISSNSMKNKIDLEISDTGNIGADFLGTFVYFSSFSAKFKGDIVIDPNGFVYQSQLGEISIKNTTIANISGKVSKSVDLVSIFVYWPILLIPIVNSIFTAWFAGAQNQIISRSFTTSVSFEPNFNTNDNANIITISKDLGSGAGGAEVPVSESIIINRDVNDNNTLIGELYFTLELSGTLGDIILSEPVSKITIFNQIDDTLQYLRTWKDPTIDIAITDAIVVTKTNDLNVIVFNNMVSPDQLALRNIEIELSIENETNSDSLRFTMDNLTSFNYIINELTTAFCMNTTKIVPKNLSKTTIKARIVSYQLFIHGSTIDVTLNNNLGTISVVKTITILNETADPQIFHISGDYKKQDTPNDFSEPGEGFEITIQIKNVGFKPCKNLKLLVYFRRSGEEYNLPIVLNYMTYLAENSTGILENYTLSLTLVDTYFIRFGFNFEYNSSQGPINITKTNFDPLELPDETIDIEKNISISNNPTILISFSSGDGYEELSVNLKNNAQSVNLYFDTSVQQTYVKKIYEGLTIDDVLGAIFGFVGDVIDEVFEPMLPTPGYDENPASYTLKLIKKLLEMKFISEEAKNKAGIQGFAIDLGIRAGFTILYYLLYGFSQVLEVKDLRSKNLFPISMVNFTNYQQNITLSERLIFKDWQITDPKGWWLWYWTTGYTKIEETLKFTFHVYDEYGNNYNPDVETTAHNKATYPDKATHSYDGTIKTVDNVNININVADFWKTIADIRLGQWLDFLIASSTIIVEVILVCLPFGIGAFFSPLLMPHIIGNAISAAISIAVCGVMTLIVLFDPDENYTNVVEPIPYPIQEMFLNDSQSALAAERAEILSNIYGYINASKITNFRMTAAKNDFNSTYIDLQANALLNFTEKIDFYCNDLLINALLHDSGNKTIIDNQTAEETAEFIKENGITPDLEQKLKPLEDDAQEAMNPSDYPTNITEFNSTDFFEEEFTSKINKTMVQQILNNSLSLNETLKFVFKVKAFSSYLRQEAFNGKIYIETQINNETVSDLSPSQQSNLTYWNSSLLNALNDHNYTNLQYYMEELNDTIWDILLTTNNGSIVPYYEKVVSAKYNLINQIRFTSINYPNLIVLDKTKEKSYENYSFSVMNSGFLNTTFKAEMISFPSEFSTDFVANQFYLGRNDRIIQNFTISLPNNTILNKTNYEFQIKISSLINPNIYEILNYSVEIANYDFEARIIDVIDSIQPGDKAKYLLEIENLGNTYDIYEISYSGTLPEDWFTHPVELFMMDDNADNYSILVDVPRLPTSTPGLYTCFINIQSFYNSSLNKSYQFNVEILPYYEFSSYIELLNNAIEPGDSFLFNLSIYNFGNTIETYSLEILNLPDGWSLNTTSVTLSPNESKSMIVALDVIRNYTIQPLNYSLQFRLNSTSLADYYDEFGFTVKIIPFVDLIYEITPLTLQVPVDSQTGIYKVKITNMGNIPENISFTCSQQPANSWLTPLDTVELDILESVTLILNLTVPKSWDSFAGGYNFTLDIQMENYNKIDSKYFEFTVLPFYDFTLNYNPLSFTIDPGDSNDIIFQIGNLGNIATTFDIKDLIGLSSDWYSINNLPITLDPGQNSTFTVSVSPPRSPYTTPGTYSFSGKVYVLEDNAVFKTFLTTITILPFAEFDYSIEPSSLEIFMGYSKEVEISITNLGNINDTFMIDLSFNNSLVENFTQIDATEVNLSIDSSKTIKLTITVPLMPLIEDINGLIKVNISSVFDPSISAESEITLKIIASPIGMLQYVILKLQELKNYAKDNFSECLSKKVICKLNISEKFLDMAICAYNKCYETTSIIFEMVSEALLSISELYLDLAELFNCIDYNITNPFHTKLYLIYSQITLIKARTIDTNIAYEIAEVKINMLNIALWIKTGQNFWLELLNYLKIKSIILALDVALLMQSLNNSQATYNNLYSASYKISCTISSISFLSLFNLIDEETKEYLITNLEMNKALIEEISGQI